MEKARFAKVLKKTKTAGNKNSRSELGDKDSLWHDTLKIVHNMKKITVKIRLLFKGKLLLRKGKLSTKLSFGIVDILLRPGRRLSTSIKE